MKQARMALTLVFISGMLTGWQGYRYLSAQPTSVTRTELLRTDLVGVEGKEVVMVLAEIAPGATTGPHLHAGQEFAYLLEGSLRLVVAGKPPVTFKPGEAVQQPPQQVHEGQNPSATTPAKILAVYVADKGQPLTTPMPQ